MSCDRERHFILKSSISKSFVGFLRNLMLILIHAGAEDHQVYLHMKVISVGQPVILLYELHWDECKTL